MTVWTGDLKQQLAEAVASSPLHASRAFMAVISREDFAGVIPAASVERITSELQLTLQDLMQECIPIARVYSVAPISNYHVGAVARGASGALYFGFNMEFPGSTLAETVHGEQAAVTNAWTHGERRITDMAISAAPCGHCRQFLHETAAGEDMQIHLPGGMGMSLKSLLPSAFGPKDLGITAGLMANVPTSPFGKGVPSHSSMARRVAEQALQEGYGPYSRCAAGIALQLTSGDIVAGWYAENAAFNPTLEPLQSALISLRLLGSDPSDIAHCILVDAPGPLDHRFRTKELLRLLAPKALLTAYHAQRSMRKSSPGETSLNG